MPKSSNPFEYRPEFTPTILNQVDKNTGARQFLGFTLFDGLIEVGPNADITTDQRLRIMARLALSQTFNMIAQRLDLQAWQVSSEAKKTMDTLGVKVHHAILPAALKSGVLEVIAYANKDCVVTPVQNLQTIQQLANNKTSQEVADAENVKEHVISSRIHRAGIDMGFGGRELLVTAACITDLIDLKSLQFGDAN